jgi:Na+/melibiose symporter-like transporter
MPLFLASLPLWQSALLIVVIPTLIAMLGPNVVRRRVSLERLASNNEIAGFKFATVGVIYAVLLAFAIIVVWEKFSSAEEAAVNEAGAAATVFRLAEGTTPTAVATRAALADYLKLAIERDWPAMAHEGASREVTHSLDVLYERTLRLSEEGGKQTAIMVEILNQLDTMTQARRLRLHLATGIVPGVVWVTLFVGAVLTIAFTFFFGSESLPAQVLMTGILSLVIFMGLLVIVSIDHPFTGPVHVGNEALELVLDDFGGG